MIPYFCVAGIAEMMMKGNRSFADYCIIFVIAAAGYIGKVIFSNLSTAISHTAAFRTLRDIRKRITDKLTRVPMGTIQNTPSGQYKTTIVDRIEGMESTFVHLIPEMTANVLIPFCLIVYLFILDWRMALISLITPVVGFGV